MLTGRARFRGPTPRCAMVGVCGATSRGQARSALALLVGLYVSEVSGQSESVIQHTAERRLEEEGYVCEVRSRFFSRVYALLINAADNAYCRSSRRSCFGMLISERQRSLASQQCLAATTL